MDDRWWRTDGWRENGEADVRCSALCFLLGHALVVKL